MNVWFSSDWHFSHKNFLKFTNADGTRCRPFDSVEEMDEMMIDRHNSMVKDHDKFYTLGDVCFDRKRFEAIMPRLKGQKRLIMGNHDKFSPDVYGKYFHKVLESWQPVRNLVFTHRPILLGSTEAKLQLNVHGHTHQHIIDDPRYLNICVEQNDYYPVHWEDIKKIYNDRGFSVG